MDRIETARKFFSQAQKMTIAMGTSVLAYGAIGFYLIHIGKVGPAVLSAQNYLLVKYGTLVLSILGIFGMGQLVERGSLSIVQPQGVATERSVQKIFLRTVLMCAAAEVPVLLGMILVFFGHQPYDYIPFAAVSLAGFTFAFPKKQQWVHWLGTDF